MTRDEVSALKPSPEMDELIHRVVFNEDPKEGYNHYSRSMSDAWQVVDQINKTYHRMFVLEVGGFDKTNTIWRCTIKGECIVYASLASEAICKAALLAVLNKEEYKRNGVKKEETE